MDDVNLTNVNASNRNYFGIEKMKQPIEKILESFTSQDAIRFFEDEVGIICNEENRGKVYPLSGQAASIVDGLRFYAQKSWNRDNYRFFMSQKLRRKMFDFKIISEDKRQIIAKKVVLALVESLILNLVQTGAAMSLQRPLGILLPN